MVQQDPVSGYSPNLIEIEERDQANHLVATYVGTSGGPSNENGRVDVIVSSQNPITESFVWCEMRCRFPKTQTLMWGVPWMFSCQRDIRIVWRRIILSMLVSNVEWMKLTLELLDIRFMWGKTGFEGELGYWFLLKDSLQAFSSSIAGLLSSRAVLEGWSPFKTHHLFST